MSINPQLQEKIDLLNKWDEAYYSNDAPLVSDEKYDLVKDYVLKNLPPESTELKELLKKIGHTPSTGWSKETHIINMGSQLKVSNQTDIRSWWSSTLAKVGEKNAVSVLEEKMDGFSLEVKYKNGKLSSAVTRGDGSFGENITHNARRFRGLPGILPISKDIVVRGEGILFAADFEHIQQLTGRVYKNPRSAASGISRRYDGTYSEFVRFIAFDINANVETEESKIEVLKKLGFETVPAVKCLDIEEIIIKYEEYKTKIRDTLAYDIDGLVLKVNDLEYQDKLGYLNNKPLGQIALKFSSDQAITKLRDISLQIGRTGKITPVALLEPIELMGSMITKASLHNFAYIEGAFISPEAEVVIEKKGDIIPQVVDLVTAGKGYTKPDVCPSCGKSLYWDTVNLWCKSKKCREKEIARILYWVKVLDIKGYSSSFIDKLWDSGKVRNVHDLYKLKEEDLSSIDGFGAKTIIGFLEAIKENSTMLLEQFIIALGIPTVSTSTAQVLVEKFKTWDAISKVTVSDLEALPGFAKVSAENAVKGIQEIADMASDLLMFITIKEKKKGSLTGLSFCVTGSLNRISRKEFEAFVKENGGTFKSSIASDLSYLVTNTPNSGSGKNAKVAKINEKLATDGSPGIKIITEDEFFKLAGAEPTKEVVENPKEVKKDDDDPILEFHPLF